MNTTLTMNYLDKKAKLSSLWIFVFLNMIFRDLHQFGNVEFVEGMMTGVVDGVQITEGLMLIGGIMIAVPLLMVPLNQFLNFRANRFANLVIGVLQIVVIIGVNMAPDLDDIFFAVIELTALVLIVRLAWNWKEPAA
jgi:predicted tellurium resistance membrane protein TerC